MYPIVKKEKLADKIFLMDVKAPRVADNCLPRNMDKIAGGASLAPKRKWEREFH